MSAPGAVVAEAPADARGGGARVGPWRVVLAVARFEAMRLLRHPLVVLGAIGSLALLWWDYRDVGPVLERDSVGIAGRLLVLAATVLLAAHGMTTRSRRGGMDEILGGVPVRPTLRVAGEALAGLAPVALATAILAAGMAWLAAGDPIGDWLWLELAVAPTFVALAHALGLALGTWLPARVTPFVALVGLFYLQVWAHPHVGSGDSALLVALAPYHPLSEWEPYVWQARAPGEELVWLLALIAVLVIAALLRRGHGRVLLATGAVVTLAAVVAGPTAVRAVADYRGDIVLPPGVEYGPHVAVRFLVAYEERVEARDPEVCATTDDGVTFCAMPGFRDWTPRWHEATRRVTEVLPVDGLLVRQARGSWAFGGDTREVLTGMWWDRRGAGARNELELAALVAMRAVTPADRYAPAEIDLEALEPDELQRAFAELSNPCWLGGEARGAIAMWLAARGDQPLTSELGRLVEESRQRTMRTSGLPEDGAQLGTALPFTPLWLGIASSAGGVGVPDAELALEMLALPDDEVRAVVLGGLDRWLDPATSNQELATVLGLPAPAQEGDPPPPDWLMPRCA